MSFLKDIHDMTEFDGQMKKAYLSAYSTIINYLEFVDDGKGFSEKYLKDRFNHRVEFKIILSKLISHSILKKSNDGVYYLNKEYKKVNSPIFDNSMFMANKKKEQHNDPTNRFLYN